MPNTTRMVMTPQTPDDNRIVYPGRRSNLSTDRLAVAKGRLPNAAPTWSAQRLASILPRRGGLRHKGPRATSTAADPRPAPPSGGRAASLRPCLVGPPVSGNTVHGRLRTAILLASSSPESSSPAPEGQPPAIESPTPEQDLGKFGQTPASLILTLLHRHIEMKENELRKFGQEPPIGGVEKPDHEQNVCGLIDPANSKLTVSGRFQK